MIGDESRDPDIRDPTEGQRTEMVDALPPVTRMEAPAPATYATVRDGSFNDGWREIIRLLHGTLTVEQSALILEKFHQIKNRGPDGR